MKPVRAGLVPEVRTDRDGVQRTRWVRPGTTTPAARRTVPAAVVAAPALPAEDPMDRPRPLPFKRVGYSAIGAALDREFGEDDGNASIEVTDRLWYEAKQAGLAEMQLRAFLRAGFTDVEAMVEYAKGCRDREFSRRNLPGIAAHREKWLRALVDAGVSREMFSAADHNIGNRTSLDDWLIDFETNADPVALVRMSAATSNKSTLAAVAGVLRSCPGFTYDHVKAIGATRVAQHEETIRMYVGRGVSADEFVAVAAHEKKARSVLHGRVRPRLEPRLNAVQTFGLDRALRLREPTLILPPAGWPLDSPVERLPADAKFEYAQYLDAVFDASLRSGTATGLLSTTITIDRSPDYGHLGKVRSARVPGRDETYPYFLAGLAPAETARALEDGMSPQAAAGAYREGIAAPIAEGWL